MRYICEAEDLTSAIFNNSSAAVTTLYQRLFKNNSKFSGPLIMGHDKIEISEQLLKGVTFRLFVCFIRKFWLFVYGIGVFSEEQLYYAVSVLQEHKGIDLFGISHPQIQTFIQILLIPRYQSEEWHIINKMQALWNYHL
ncbi:10259_t:CDS:2 [Funneliformis caledonium]|uniref:10259_t:CDS:1 n=1 Tax=Funneliformis caledonium TaxID=1117310 RepID=A0A9N9ILN5_9GLOM|nr:10259_t:CDS:2 [Funneliformis caledonium]